MSIRKERLEELIKRIVSDLLIKEIKDPRIGFITITGVELSRDYSYARIGVSVLGSPREMRQTLEGLKSAAGFIQHKVGKNIRLRVTPRIDFFLDSSVADGVEMVNLLDDLVNDKDREENQESSEVHDEG